MAYETQLGAGRIARTPQGASVTLPRMWYVFVFACLAFGLFAGARLFLDYPGLPLFLLGLIGLTALTGVFLWITLRDSLSAEDITPPGVEGRVLHRRLLLIAAMLLLTHTLIPIMPEFQLWWLLSFAMVAAGLALPLIPAKLMIAGLTALSMLHAWYFDSAFQPILLSLAVLALGAVIIRIMTITNIELEASRDEITRLAVTEERLRFARDLHDSLGHTLSTIVLKSELGGRIVTRDPERAGDEMRDVERVARDALGELRSVVTGYRQPTLSSEIETARQVLAAANIAVQVEADPEQLPAKVDSILAWGVREGVTNVVRHSGAGHCTIRTIRQNGTARLEIIDDGRPGSNILVYRHTGNGLAGLTERVTRAGGWLAANVRDEGGFHLVLEAPTSSESELTE